MREVLKLGEQLTAKLAEETAIMLAERNMLRDMAAARTRELTTKRDEELTRIEGWAEKQKAIVKEVFAAMLTESEHDWQKHQEAINRLNGDAAAPTQPWSTSSRSRHWTPMQHAAE